MGRSRTWNLKLNLDEFNAAFGALFSNPERAQFVCGLSCGMNSGVNRPGMSAAFSEGCRIGSRARQETESYREIQTTNGVKGGRPPRNRGKSQPKPMGSDSEIQSEPKVKPNETLTNNQKTNNHQPPTNSQAMAPLEPVVVIAGSMENIQAESARESFERIWNRWPPERKDGGRTKGHRVDAERAFHKILDLRMATMEELEAAVDHYLTRNPKVRKGYVCNVDTFFDDQKALWLENVQSKRARPANDKGCRLHNAPCEPKTMPQEVRELVVEEGLDLKNPEEVRFLINTAKKRGWEISALQNLPELTGVDIVPLDGSRPTCGPMCEVNL